MSLPLKDRPLAFMDTETTGLIPGEHEVIEISITKVHRTSGKRELFYTLIRPEHIENAQPEALACNGYKENPSAWNDAPTIREVAPGLLEFLKGTVIIAHNVTYDVAMVNGVLQRAGIFEKIPHHKIDTVTLCFEHLVPMGLTSLRLPAVREFLGWSNEGAHRAGKDVEDMMRLYFLLERASWFTRFRIWLFRKFRVPVRW